MKLENTVYGRGIRSGRLWVGRDARRVRPADIRNQRRAQRALAGSLQRIEASLAFADRRHQAWSDRYWKRDQALKDKAQRGRGDYRDLYGRDRQLRHIVSRSEAWQAREKWLKEARTEIRNMQARVT